MFSKGLPCLLAGAITALSAVVGTAQSAPTAFRGTMPVQSSLPLPSDAKLVLNTTQRHREWITATVGGAEIRAFVVYPERADKGPIVLLDERNQGASDWIRAAGDRLAAEGYIAVVPDVLSGLGPHGGDTNSFATPQAAAGAVARLGQREVARRRHAVAALAATLPAANGKIATVEMSHSIAGALIITVSVSAKRATYENADAWQNSIGFLNRATDNRPVAGESPDVPEDHSAHMRMAMAEAPAPSATAAAPLGMPMGYPLTKPRNLPAGLLTARSTMLHSTVQSGWVDIPFGDIKLHIWVEYPAGNVKAPVVLVMQQAPGLDDWQRSIADQLALEGFIAVAPDLYSGLGPNGGNYDSFDGPDAAIRALGRLYGDAVFQRYKAAYDWAIGLPRASEKVGTMGFCAGGGASFEFAGRVPQIDAAVVFYGGPPSVDVMAKIRAPIIGFYGQDDERLTATVAPTARKMQELGKSYEYHIYPRATHGFIDVQDLDHNSAAVADSWPRAIAFLNRYLR